MTIATNAQPARFPCSPTQTQFIMFDAMGQGRTALNFAFRYRIDGPLRVEVLQQAFDVLLARHEILRTGFVADGGVTVQEVAPSVRGPVRMLDFSRLDEAAAEEAANQAGHDEAAQPFDLTRPPLVRLTLIKFGTVRFNLLITAHASVIDGWSLSILLSELGTAMAAFHAGAAPHLPDVEMHFGDYALWQAEMAKSNAFAGDLAFWRTELDGASTFAVPPTRAVPEARTYPSMTRGVWLPKAATDRVRADAQSRGLTFYQMALASLAAVLHRRTGAPEIVIGTQVSGRNDEDAEGIAGPLINAVVLRLSVSPDEPLSQLVAHAAEKSANALTHQSLPFASMVEAVAPVQATQRNPLYAINFALQAAFIHDDNADFKAYGPFEIHSLPSQSHNAIWDMNFGLVERPEGWRMSCEADGELFDAHFIDEILADWSKALVCVADQPELVVGELPVAGVSVPAVAASRIRPAPSVAATRSTAAVTAITAGRLPADDRVIIFNKRAAGVPVMALNVTSLYHGLASADPSRPFYDIQLPDDEPPKHFTPRAIQDLTTDAVRMIRRARPHGPYVLLGYCVVGTLALEAARRLREEGEDVPLVVMIDTWAPGYRERLPWYKKILRGAYVRRHNAKLDLARARRGEMTYAQVFEGLGLMAALRRFFRLPAPATAPTNALTEPHPHEWYLQPLYFAYHFHHPEAYDGRTLIFRAAEVCEGSMFPRDFGWSKILIGPNAIVDVPGEHHAALASPSPGLDAISGEMRRILAEIDAAHASPLPFGALRQS